MDLTQLLPMLFGISPANAADSTASGWGPPPAAAAPPPMPPAPMPPAMQPQVGPQGPDLAQFGPPAPPDLGQSLEPAPPTGSVPAPSPAGSGAGYYGGSPETNPALAPMGGAAAAPGGGLSGALKGMSGAVAPQISPAQRVATPAPPRTDPIKSGNIAALMMAMGMGGGQGGGGGAGYQLPSTLGASYGQR